MADKQNTDIKEAISSVKIKIEDMKDLEPEFQEVIEENFWELL